MLPLKRANLVKSKWQSMQSSGSKYVEHIYAIVENYDELVFFKTISYNGSDIVASQQY